MTNGNVISYTVNEPSMPAPRIDQAVDGVLDPSARKAVVRVAPYSGMACGDRLRLSWVGLDAEGYAYDHEVSRFVSERQLGRDVIFAVPSVHIEAIDGGSLEVYCTLNSGVLPGPVQSRRLQLGIGDEAPQLLPAVVNDAVGGTLDPQRVEEGARITVRPYARMAVGDRILLSWTADASATCFHDTLRVQSYAVGDDVSFWVGPECIGPNLGRTVTVSYCIEQAGQPPRFSEPVQLLIGRMTRGALLAASVLEADQGWLDLQDAIDGVTIVIDQAGAEEGELVYLKCDGVNFSHRDQREISREMAGRPLVFVVPYRFWRGHEGLNIRVSYSVERLDDVSQQSAVTTIQIQP